MATKRQTDWVAIHDCLLEVLRYILLRECLVDDLPWDDSVDSHMDVLVSMAGHLHKYGSLSDEELSTVLRRTHGRRVIRGTPPPTKE